MSASRDLAELRIMPRQLMLNKLPETLPFVAPEAQKLKADSVLRGITNDSGLNGKRNVFVRNLHSDPHNARQREQVMGSHGASPHGDLDRRPNRARVIKRQQLNGKINANPLIFALIFVDSEIANTGLKQFKAMRA